MIEIFQRYNDLIKPFIDRSDNDKKDPEVNLQQLGDGLAYLINHVNSRYIAITSFIN